VELAAIAGPRGSVVGVDSSAEAIETARAIINRENLNTVRVVHGDIHTLDLLAITRNRFFDAAHMRFVLVHQHDPAFTLRRAAALVRPGGYVLVSDIVNDPRYPWFDPPLPAHETAAAFIFETVARRGASVDAGRRLPQL
jgi:SAM-dependent methyltransferase